MTEKMIIELKNSKPVDLIGYSNSLLCLADEYRQFLLTEQGTPSANESRLYIKEVKAGSIITDLISQSHGVLPMMADFNNVTAFSLYLKTFIETLSSDSGNTQYGKKNLENISGFVNPIAEDSGSQINVKTEINGDVNLVINFDSTQANAIQNKVRKNIESMKQPLSGIYTNALLYWFQTRNDPHSQAGYRGIIEEVSQASVRVQMSPELKEQIIASDDNFFKLAYLVDVKVSTVEGKPRLYEILTLHDKFPKDQ